jgi:hypothetical protein
MQPNLKRAALLAALALSTSACATAYGELGQGWMHDGVAADQLGRDVFRIRSRGNGMTEPAQVQDFALLRAAETVRSACMTHFVVLEGADRTEVDEDFTPEQEIISVEEKLVDGKKVKVEKRTHIPGHTSITVRPGQDLVIKGLMVPRGQPAPMEAISADEILTYVSPRVKRRKDAPPPIFPVCPGHA